MFPIAFSVLVIFELVCRTQTFRLMADSGSFQRTAQEVFWPTSKATNHSFCSTSCLGAWQCEVDAPTITDWHASLEIDVFSCQESMQWMSHTFKYPAFSWSWSLSQLETRVFFFLGLFGVTFAENVLTLKPSKMYMTLCLFRNRLRILHYITCSLIDPLQWTVQSE